MLDFPCFVEFELTNHCNLRCIMCPQTIMERKKGYMEYATIKKVLHEGRGKIKNTYLHQIGEPLLHPEHIRFINLANDYGLHTSISTNCMLLDTYRSKNIINSKLDEIVLCLDGTNKETAEKIRPGSDFSIVVANMINFISMVRSERKGPDIIIQMIVMNENREQAEQFKKLWEHKVEGIGKVDLKGYSTFAGKVVKEEETPDRRFNCNKPNTHMTIQWNGDVVPCCRDFNAVSVMGNVNYNTVQEIWNNEKYRDFRAGLSSKEFPELCKEC